MQRTAAVATCAMKCALTALPKSFICSTMSDGTRPIASHSCRRTWFRARFKLCMTSSVPWPARSAERAVHQLCRAVASPGWAGGSMAWPTASAVRRATSHTCDHHTHVMITTSCATHLPPSPPNTLRGLGSPVVRSPHSSCCGSMLMTTAALGSLTARFGRAVAPRQVRVPAIHSQTHG